MTTETIARPFTLQDYNRGVYASMLAYRDDPFAASKASAYGQWMGRLQRGIIDRQEFEKAAAEIRAWQ